jgi:hypothetical protein
MTLAIYQFEVVPLVGIGPVKLGMSRGQSRAAIGLTFEPFEKSPGVPIDAYLGSHYQVFFDSAGLVEYIELSGDGPVVALYRQISVFETKVEALVAHLCRDADYDRTDWELGYSYIFPKLALSVWRPIMDNAEHPYFATIGVGIRGYYGQA